MTQKIEVGMLVKLRSRATSYSSLSLGKRMIFVLGSQPAHFQARVGDTALIAAITADGTELFHFPDGQRSVWPPPGDGFLHSWEPAEVSDEV